MTDDPSVSMVETVQFLRRHVRLLATSIAAAALGSLLVFGWLIPRKYEAAATLILMPSKLSSELKPQAMSVQGFQRLLESDQVIVETRSRLVSEKGIQVDLSLGKNLRSKIYVSHREENRTLAPVIELFAQASTPEGSAAIANVWSDVFLEAIHKIQSSSTEANIQLVEELYMESREIVSSLEDERLEAQGGFRNQLVTAQQAWNEKLSAASSKWDRQIGEAQNASEELMTKYQLETRREMEAVIEDIGFSVGGESQAGDAADTVESLDEKTTSHLTQLVALRTQLAQTLELLTLEKGISNDTIWQTALLEQTEDLDAERLWTSQLVTEELNPTYTDLLLRTSQIETELKSSFHAARDRAVVDQAQSRLEELQRRRSAGLKSLNQEGDRVLTQTKASKSRALADLQLDRAKELDLIQQQAEVKIGQVQRRLDNQTDLLNDMAKRYSQAALARGEQDLADIRLGAMAMPPFEPRSRGLPLKLALSTFLGFCVGLMAGIVRDVTDD